MAKQIINDDKNLLSIHEVIKKTGLKYWQIVYLLRRGQVPGARLIVRFTKRQNNSIVGIPAAWCARVVDETENYLTIAQAARELGISRARLYSQVNAGRFKTFKIGYNNCAKIHKAEIASKKAGTI